MNELYFLLTQVPGLHRLFQWISVKDTPATAGKSREGAACIRKVEVSCNADGRKYEWKPKNLKGTFAEWRGCNFEKTRVMGHSMSEIQWKGVTGDGYEFYERTGM